MSFGMHLLVVFIGIAAAGVAQSAYRLLISDRPRFDKRPEAPSKAVLHVILLLFCGPLVLARNSYRGRMMHGRPIGWIAASGGIAAGWCLMSGVFILTVIEFARGLLA
ncbi:DUF6949 family protein [Tepidamorphus sp. 3E244]|uniref:DUF6949 family protein n=1 Tax=Tepidamorphus sp. 3E244 TaxID=3385498 RepID=UPI0038FC5AAB